jgi:hypothetical protein
MTRQGSVSSRRAGIRQTELRWTACRPSSRETGLVPFGQHQPPPIPACRAPVGRYRHATSTAKAVVDARVEWNRGQALRGPLANAADRRCDYCSDPIGPGVTPRPTFPRPTSPPTRATTPESDIDRTSALQPNPHCTRSACPARWHRRCAVRSKGLLELHSHKPWTYKPWFHKPWFHKPWFHKPWFHTPWTHKPWFHKP